MSLSVDLTGPSGESALNFDNDQYGPISRSETLWAISSKLKPDNSVSVHQTMVALYKLNPDAFDNGNINKIIANSTLEIPSYEFVAQQTNAEAAALIRKYSAQKAVVVKKETPKAIEKPVESIIENVKELSVKETKAPEVEAKDSVDKEKFDATEDKLLSLQEEMRLLNEQFIVATEATQVLKLKLQPLSDEINILSEQLAEETVINEKLQKIIDEYRAQLDAVELPPYSGEGFFNEMLRLITSSLTNLLIVILSPLLLFALVFVLISRIRTKRLLAEQEQEMAESTAILMEEAGQFDMLLTDDVSDEDDLEGPDSLSMDASDSVEEINLDDDEEDEQELDVVDLTEDDDELITSDDDPFGINALSDDEELISSVELDDIDEDELLSINLDDDDFEDPFGTDEVKEDIIDLDEVDSDEVDLDEVDLDKVDLDKIDLDEVDLDEIDLDEIDLDEVDLDEVDLDEVDLDESIDSVDTKEISASDQADLDLAAEWEAQLSADSATETDEIVEKTDEDSESNTKDIDDQESTLDSKNDVQENELETEEKTSETLSDEELIDLETLEDSDVIDLDELENIDDEDLDDIDADLFDNIDFDDIKETSDLDLDAIDLTDVDAQEGLDELDIDETESIHNEEVDIDLSEFESEDTAEDKKNDKQDNLAQQLSDVAFNEEVPLPKVDKASKDDFIDIETLLENSGMNDDEPYSELDLDLGLEEFPDVVDLQESVDIDDDENGIGAQLDLARAYLEIDDQAGAKEILMSVVDNSNGAQRIEIDKLLSRLK
tara:strand:- start:30889 stop:33225 length:2337 start_codon:yes stop_codon:yes gene_type:complete